MLLILFKGLLGSHLLPSALKSDKGMSFFIDYTKLLYLSTWKCASLSSTFFLYYFLGDGTPCFSILSWWSLFSFWNQLLKLLVWSIPHIFAPTFSILVLFFPLTHPLLPVYSFTHSLNKYLLMTNLLHSSTSQAMFWQLEIK